MSPNQLHNIRRIFAVGERFFSASSFRYPKGSRKDRRCGFRFPFPFQLYRVPLCSRAAACLRLRSHDFIILSTHGRTGLAHVFLGSTAEQVIRRVGCHVLVVRENEREFVRNTKRAIGRYRRSADVD